MSDTWDKEEAKEVMELFADCLRILYKQVNLDIPSDFDPVIEADRISTAYEVRGYLNGLGRMLS